MLALFFALIAFPILSITHAQTTVSDYWNCTNRVGGSWVFGQAPDGCDSSDFGPDSDIFQDYPTLIYNTQASQATELPRYMTQMNAFINEVASRYYLGRNANASSAEVASWVHAIETVAEQESYWSQYRVVPGLKFMRGDFGHGHGMLQLDDRWHFAQIEKGEAWNLIQNFLIGLDEYYSGWTEALKASCYTGSPSDRNRARTAYDYYNGGASSICRWTDSGSPWAYIDVSFAQFYDEENWNHYVTNPSATADVDLNCLMGGSLSCPAPRLSAPGYTRLLAGKIYRLNSNSYCLWDSSQMQCVSRAEDVTCLAQYYRVPSNWTQAPAQLNEQVKKIYANRLNLCQQADPSLFKVGDQVTLSAPLAVSQIADGPAVSILPAGSSVQILDVQLKANGERNYLIYFDHLQGYVGIKDAQVQTQLMKPTMGGAQVIASPGEKIRILIPGGIHVRSEANNSILETLDQGDSAVVEEVSVRGDDNQVFYKVRTANHEGIVFSGHLIPDLTITEWTTPSR